ncbi:MAG TPA: glycosyltransferase family 4 protein [Rickettsiales bacterium]|nr:glycosyltransferase family 4 protein [Rickettsiales bacterium]
MNDIVSILPKGEGFSPDQFGAIALCVRDFTLHSAYRDRTVILGGMEGKSFKGLRYEGMRKAKWYENRTRAYARVCTEYIRKHEVGLVEIHNRPAMLHMIARRVKCPLALHLHNDPQEMEAARTARERKKLLEICDAVYCVSGYIRNRFLEGIEQEAHAKVHVIYNGIEVPDTMPEKEKTITFVGRMTEGKGALLLAQALRIALPQLPEWKAVLIGSRRHEVAKHLTPHELQIADMLKPLGKQVEMTGFLSHEETMTVFGKSAIAVVPSVWQEPFGRTAIEAMAEGCALISSGRGGLYEVTGDAALTPQELTPHSLATSIMQLAQDDTERLRMQTAGRERARYFSIARRTQLLDKVRQSILKEKYEDG